MNRNVESHFAELPGVDIKRSMFDRSASHKTSFDVSDLVPFYVDEVLPGDTFRITTSVVARLQTLLAPIYDNVYMDTYWFFVPNRIVWKHWPNLMGENDQSAWYPTTKYRVPTVSYPEGGFQIGTIADYLGIPTGVVPIGVGDADFNPMALPFRGYAKIADTWFRDQNVTDPLNIPDGDSNQTGSNGSDYVNDVANGGKPFKVAKYHDYFTSCLPGAQKSSEPVKLFNPNLPGVADAFQIPVVTGSLRDDKTGNVIQGYVGDESVLLRRSTSTQTPSQAVLSSGNPELGFEPTNLWADLSYANVTINELRLAFQLQKYYEKAARGGSRYRETILSHFGVHSPDARMMIPEYLGGHRFPLTIHQVTNQSQGESDFLGDLGAMSATADVHEDFVKSFTEHGFIFGLCCVRYDHSYPQGLEKFWRRRTDTDYYWPVFANIGEQPVRTCEIYLGDGAQEDDVFGFQEAWAEYRYKPSRVSSLMRPSAPQSLAHWNLSDHYTQKPILSDAWIREDKANVDRTLAVTSAVANQVTADFYVKNVCTRPMPMYSVPGLIDHH